VLYKAQTYNHASGLDLPPLAVVYPQSPLCDQTVPAPDPARPQPDPPKPKRVPNLVPAAFDTAFDTSAALETALQQEHYQQLWGGETAHKNALCLMPCTTNPAAETSATYK